MDNKKKKQVSCRAFSKFVGQFIDRYNWGWINDDGDPSFRYTAGYISSVSYKSWIKLRTYFRSPQQNRTTCLKAHLKARDGGEVRKLGRSRRRQVAWPLHVYLRAPRGRQVG